MSTAIWFCPSDCRRCVSRRAIQYPGQLNLAASAMGTKPSPLPASQVRHLVTALGNSVAATAAE
jgi:hypothetical protein